VVIRVIKAKQAEAPCSKAHKNPYTSISQTIPKYTQVVDEISCYFFLIFISHLSYLCNPRDIKRGKKKLYNALPSQTSQVLNYYPSTSSKPLFLPKEKPQSPNPRNPLQEHRRSNQHTRQTKHHTRRLNSCHGPRRSLFRGPACGRSASGRATGAIAARGCSSSDRRGGTFGAGHALAGVEVHGGGFGNILVVG
jgi:hypothetical protein